MTDQITLDLSKLSAEENRVVRTYLLSRSVDGAAKVANVSPETVKRYLRRAGAPLAVQRLIDAGTPVVLANEDAKKPEPQRLDLVEKHRFEQNEKLLKDQVKNLTARLAAAEDIRASILGLRLERVEPICAPQVAKTGERGKQGVVLHLSDTHVGEVVDMDETMGVNKYNRDIARKRIGRLFETATILTTTAWPRSDDAPHRIYILLGGDLVSGHGLHPELAETDAGTAYEQCKWAANYIASGALGWSLDLADHWGREVEIIFISVGGNHGRMTFGKPRAKLAAIQSYDTLVADFVEAALKGYSNFRFHTPRAFDAYFDVVGWPCLLTHGDRMSAGGGTGFIGPAANIVKGHKKVMLTEAQQRRPVRYVFSGHFHTRLVTPWGFGNGALVGYSEFAKSIRADAEPASQNFAVLHERLGLLREQPIVVGTPDEGSIYSPNGGLIMPTSTEGLYE